jgi:ATP-dependent RNA helicase SUPV3L1/SUV3
LLPGPSLARPLVTLDRVLDVLDKPDRTAVQARLERWLHDQLTHHAPSLARLADMARDRDATPALRVIAGALEATGGMTPRVPLRAEVDALTPEERKRLRQAGVTIGALDLFAPALLKPGAARWRRVLLALRGTPPPEVAAGATVLPRGGPGAVLAAGFRPLAAQAVRLDLVERLARAAHDARAGRRAFIPDPALATSMGLQEPTIARLMAELGFRPAKQPDGQGGWAWRGRPPARGAAPSPEDPFAALTRWAAGG